ncbi:hypothetical protein MTP03_14330 [Tsukamurella sp. PLM1]|nr:hypothetical protein MTP03_14330 [Tsukamurella sp. PLM1]
MRSPGATDLGAGVRVGAAAGLEGACDVRGVLGFGVPGLAGALGFGVAGAPGFGDGAGVGVGAALATAGTSRAPDTATVTTPIDPRRSAWARRVRSAKVDPPTVSVVNRREWKAPQKIVAEPTIPLD